MKSCSPKKQLLLRSDLQTVNRQYSWETFITQAELVSYNTMMTLTTQKTIRWSALKYVWLTTLMVSFVSNKKMKLFSFGMQSFRTHERD